MTAPDLDAIRARLEQVEADRDRWKHAYDMADPLLTERDRLAAENTKLSSLLAYARESRDAYAATLDRVRKVMNSPEVVNIHLGGGNLVGQKKVIFPEHLRAALGDDQ